jgi:hypothetical protein
MWFNGRPTDYLGGGRREGRRELHKFKIYPKFKSTGGHKKKKFTFFTTKSIFDLDSVVVMLTSQYAVFKKFFQEGGRTTWKSWRRGGGVGPGESAALHNHLLCCSPNKYVNTYTPTKGGNQVLAEKEQKIWSLGDVGWSLRTNTTY